MASFLPNPKLPLVALGLVVGCSDPNDDPAGGSETSGAPGSTTAAATSSTSAEASSGADASSGDSGSSSEGAPALPCAWVEGQHDADIPMGMTPANVLCGLDSGIVQIQIAYDGVSCSQSPSGDSLVIELPPALQRAGELDLTTVSAQIYMQADVTPVAGQVTSGTLIITEVTPTAITGWAHGALEGYDFQGSFTAGYCP